MLKIWKTTLSNNPSMMHYSWRDTSYNWYYHSKYTSLWKPMESILLIWTLRMLVCFLETGKNLNSNNCNLQSKYLHTHIDHQFWLNLPRSLSFRKILLTNIFLRTIISGNILLRTIEFFKYPPKIYPPQNYGFQKYPPQNNWIPELSSTEISYSDLFSSELSFLKTSSSE